MNHENLQIEVECPSCTRIQTFMSQDVVGVTVECPVCGGTQLLRSAKLFPCQCKICSHSKSDPELKDPERPKGFVHHINVDEESRFISHEFRPMTQQEYESIKQARAILKARLN